MCTTLRALCVSNVWGDSKRRLRLASTHQVVAYGAAEDLVLSGICAARNGPRCTLGSVAWLVERVAQAQRRKLDVVTPVAFSALWLYYIANPADISHSHTHRFISVTTVLMDTNMGVCFRTREHYSD